MANENPRTAAGEKVTKKPQPPPETTYSPEETLVAAALVNWEAVEPLADRVTKDLFCDPSVFKIWKAVAANPKAGTAAIPKDLISRSARAIELHNYEDPHAVIAIMIEARDKRALDTAAQKLQSYKDGKSAAAIWADVARYVDTTITPPAAIDTPRYTPDDLASMEFPEPEWLIPGLVPTGITLLAGRTKIGKSWLALQWGARIKGKVVYATYEDYERRLKSRTKKLGITGKDLILIPHPPWQMPQALNELAADVKKYKPSCIIIDPWVCFKPLRKDSSNIYEVDYEAFAQLRRWTNDMNVSVIVIHHTRKATAGQRGDPLDEPLGSTALTGATDTIAVLERKNDTEGILHIRGRDVEAQELALAFDGGKWENLGRASEALAGNRAEIAAILEEAGGPMTPAEVAEVIGEPRTTIKVMLGRMYAKGQVDRNPDGGYTYPVTGVTAADF